MGRSESRATTPGEGPVVSALQEELWLSLPGLGDPAALNYGAATEVVGPMDEHALRVALAEAVARHDGLRTGFRRGEGARALTALILEPGLVAIESRSRDLTDLPEEERAASARRWLRDERARPYDLACPPLVRLAMARLGPELHHVLVGFHHLVLDGVGAHLLYREVGENYAALQGAGALPIDRPAAPSYQGWARADLAARATPEAAQRAGARGEALAELAALELPVLRADIGAPAGHHTLELDPMLLARLRDGLADQRATPYLGFAAALAELTRRHFERDPVPLGATVGLRTGPGTRELVGNLANTMVLSLSPAAAETTHGLVAAAREAAFTAGRHRAVIARELAPHLPDDGPGYGELLRVLYDFEPGPGLRLDLVGAECRALDIPVAAAQFPLRWRVRPGRVVPTVTAVYDRRSLEPLRVAAMGRELELLLEALADEAPRPLREVPRLDEAGYRRVVVEANAAADTPYPQDASIPALFAEAAATAPEAPALSWRETRWSYQELGEHAARIAAKLEARGVRAGDRVGVVAWRRPETVAAFLGVLQVGAAYVPLDPRYPAERLAHMARDAGLEVAVAPGEPANSVRLPALEGVELLDVRRGWLAPKTSEPAAPAPDDLAYVMYTSGSTGRPKGVPITHRAVSRLVRENAHLTIGPGDAYAQVASLSFDVSILEIWGALLNGARLAILDHEDLQEPARVRGVLRDKGVTHLWLTTPLFDWIAGHEPGAFDELRDLYVGGARVGVEGVRAVRAAGGPARLINSYGPTETCFSSFHVVGERDLEGSSIPIGAPISNATLYVVDAEGRPVPEGVPGELWIGGPGVSPGYLGASEGGAARFGDDPFRPGERIYQSGDRVVRREDGAVVYLGRRDDQVKLRGHRVEMGEVEAALEALPGVVAAACRVVGEGAAQALAGYVVGDPQAAEPPDAGRLRYALECSLPPFMVPSTMKVLPELPLTRHGKVDRDRLPVILPGSGGTLAPLPSAGERVLQIFQAVLESPHMNADDHFFWSGATSLQALEACARLETWLGARVPLTLLQEHPTARQFFEHLPGRDPVGEARHLLRLVEGEQPGAILMMPDTDLREILVCELTRRLPPGPPVYSFRHDGYRTGALPPRSLPRLAGEFARDLTRAGLRGPLRIFGHCYGGFLGWELASQLEGQGIEVALVLLSDSWIPHWAREPGGKWEEVRRRAAKVKERALGDLREGGGLRGAWNSAQDELEKLRRNPLHDWLETSSGKEAFGGEGTPGTAMAARFADAIDLWVPERIRAPVVCGIAETWDPDPSYEYALETPEGPERRKAWLELTDGPGEVVTLPGRHSELFHTPELLDEAAAQLGEIFARYR